MCNYYLFIAIGRVRDKNNSTGGVTQIINNRIISSKNGQHSTFVEHNPVAAIKGALYRIWCSVNRLGDSGVKVV